MQARKEELQLLKLMGRSAHQPLVELLKYLAHTHYRQLAICKDHDQIFRYQGGIAVLEDVIRLVEGVDNGG